MQCSQLPLVAGGPRSGHLELDFTVVFISQQQCLYSNDHVIYTLSRLWMAAYGPCLTCEGDK